jgi:ATP-dependent protease Clp ATPase subunit
MKCSFCQKPGNDLAFLIEGLSGTMICDECVDKAAEMVKELRTANKKPKRVRKAKAEVADEVVA